jgi:hypothetical protein
MLRGGLGEPYCSEHCHELGGQTIAREHMNRWTGDCSVCRGPVALSVGSSASMVCWKPGQFLYYCPSPSCVATVRQHVAASTICVICGAPV